MYEITLTKKIGLISISFLALLFMVPTIAQAQYGMGGMGGGYGMGMGGMGGYGMGMGMGMGMGATQGPGMVNVKYGEVVYDAERERLGIRNRSKLKLNGREPTDLDLKIRKLNETVTDIVGSGQDDTAVPDFTTTSAD